MQYHEPGASQSRLAGSAIHFLLLFETLTILKMRTLPYLGIKGEGPGGGVGWGVGERGVARVCARVSVC